MASASDTHHTLRDHDGFVEALYHLLWVKNINGEPCPDILVPDVIIYKYRIPAYWYFTGADGQLKRKNKASIVNKKIFAEFTKGVKSAQISNTKGAPIQLFMLRVGQPSSAL